MWLQVLRTRSWGAAHSYMLLNVLLVSRKHKSTGGETSGERVNPAIFKVFNCFINEVHDLLGRENYRNVTLDSKLQ